MCFILGPLVTKWYGTFSGGRDDAIDSFSSIPFIFLGSLDSLLQSNGMGAPSFDGIG